MLLRQALIALGLSDKEAKLYETLMEQGEIAGGALEKVSGLGKNTYILLKSLQAKQLVVTSQRDGKRTYSTSSPDVLMLRHTEQKRALLQTGKALEAILPEAWESYRSKVGRPVVQHYSGLAGLRRTFDRVYAEGKSVIWGAFGNEVVGKQMYDEILNTYEPARVRRKIKAITISPDSARARELKKREDEDLKEKYLVNSEQYPMPAEFDTWGDFITMMKFTKGDYQSIVIECPEFAQTMQSILGLLSSLLREKESDHQSRGSNT